ncbi:Protein N-acetyltransferase, RimJ/RimL family [Lentzea waywayandensis]|uniref:Protein N-acetyltransferase, RimJ/RimL family n=1 Tax=Lentzea waywayandensis TaxID=84724 RepID=A0A1I6FF56_9PSEU|nr:GNAT family N-acetyltransferase [Lentzea waywayandensis]SFR28548.1 Protein N-acetyltransferase, RimJ/RimL family [Lentzea waywayandensis]
MKLRRLTDADAAELFQAVTESLPHLRLWMPWAANGYDASMLAEFLADAAQGWDRGTLFPHAITVDDAIVGLVTANRNRGADLVEIGYWLHPAHTGQGHATAAAAELVEFAFALDGVRRIQIWHDEANVASSGVPRRLGFTEIDRRTPPREPAIGNRVGVDVVWELRR